MLNELEKKFGLPPLRQAMDLAAGPTGKRLDRILDRLVKLNQDGTLPQAIRLLELLRDLDKEGALARLEGVLKSLPKGKQGEVLVTQLTTLVKELVPRLDRLSRLADVLLKEG